MVRACADDLGVVAHRKEALLRLRQPLAVARAAAGLRLRPGKCKFLVLGSSLSASLVMRLKGCLREAAPEWCKPDICDVGKNLGFYLGHGAAGLVWRGPMGKWEQRARDSVAIGVPAGVGCLSALPGAGPHDDVRLYRSVVSAVARS